ncbi:MAG: DUF6582 domain-containing protein [archaeon]
MITQKLESIQLSNGKKDEDTHTIKDQLLMAPGVWNDVEYSAEEIKKAFEKTNWEDKRNKSVIIDHADDDKRDVSVRDWVGWVKNARVEDDGRVYGDIELYDKDMINKLTKAKAKFGISPRIRGKVNEDKKIYDFSFENFSVVNTPAVKEAYINLSENGQMKIIKLGNISDEQLIGYISDKFDKDKEEVKKMLKDIEDGFKCECIECGHTMTSKEHCKDIKCPECGGTMRREERPGPGQETKNSDKKLEGFEEIRKEKGMSPSEFYAAPRDPPSESKLPIHDKEHIKNAMSRFNQTDFKDEEEKKKAKRKIISAARDKDIDIEKFKEVGPELSDNDYMKKDKKEVKMSEEEKEQETKAAEEENKEEVEENEEEEVTEEKEEEEEVKENEEDEEEEEEVEDEGEDEEKELKELMTEDKFQEFLKEHKSLPLKEIAKKYKEEKYELEKEEMKKQISELSKKVEKLSEESPDSKSVQELSDEDNSKKRNVFGSNEPTKGDKEMIKLLKDKKILG